MILDMARIWHKEYELDIHLSSITHQRAGLDFFEWLLQIAAKPFYTLFLKTNHHTTIFLLSYSSFSFYTPHSNCAKIMQNLLWFIVAWCWLVGGNKSWCTMYVFPLRGKFEQGVQKITHQSSGSDRKTIKQALGKYIFLDDGKIVISLGSSGCVIPNFTQDHKNSQNGKQTLTSTSGYNLRVVRDLEGHLTLYFRARTDRGPQNVYTRLHPEAQ
mmetsp:Transcript_38276/g.65351  ORF Transcript_38276/g.65351 Transcript_38276/m.65351 type:complete len:214 (+) Transcript_38276:312-953(+)